MHTLDLYTNPPIMKYNYDIVIIEGFDVDRDGNLVVTAIIENMGDCTVPWSLYDPPEFAPARCKTVIYPECLPENLEFKGKTVEELEEYVNRYCLLVNQEWEVVIPDYSDDDQDDYHPTSAGLYF